MDYFYDGQIRRYVTQFMRVFIGFKYKTGDGTLRHVPVMYGDMTRQVAAIIKENSENKMSTVPKIACYISGLEMDTSRLADASFVSKLNISERAWTEENGEIGYKNYQGAGYTVERLMPTPFKLTMKADIWTSNTDQKLQLMEQILVLFNPSLEIQTTDNYIDWTSLSVIDLSTLNFSSRTIPQGNESEIDICSIEFKMPIYISPPAKVKKLGVIRNIVANVFGETGDILALDDLIYAGIGNMIHTRNVSGNFRILLLKSNNDQANDFDVSIVSPSEVVINKTGLEPPYKTGDTVDWNTIVNQYGGYISGISKIFFLQADGNELGGTFVINELDPTRLLVSLEDRPSNTVIYSAVYPNGRTTVDAIVDPYKFNPKRPNKESSDQTIVAGARYLVLDDVNTSTSVGTTVKNPPFNPQFSYDGPDGWKNLNGSDPIIHANSIIEWTGSEWVNLIPEWVVSSPGPSQLNLIAYVQNQIVIYDGVAYQATTNMTQEENTVVPSDNDKFLAISLLFQNLKTGIQYRWGSDSQWMKSFEGEYASGYWRFDLDPL
jgi:hypothetical protein